MKLLKFLFVFIVNFLMKILTNKKAQAITIESLLFFVLGLFLCLMIYHSFDSMTKQIKLFVAEESLKKIASYISYYVNLVYRTGIKTNAKITLHIELPETVFGSEYFLHEENGKIYIRTEVFNKKVLLNLYGAEAKLRAFVVPLSNQLEIKYESGKVIIG